MILPLPRSPLFPYTTLFRSVLPHCWGQSRLSIELFLHRPVVPIHGSRVIGEGIDTRPVDILASLLLLPHSTVIDRKSTRLNSSHRCISYAVFCLKKKKKS